MSTAQEKEKVLSIWKKSAQTIHELFTHGPFESLEFLTQDNVFTLSLKISNPEEHTGWQLLERLLEPDTSLIGTLATGERVEYTLQSNGKLFRREIGAL